MEFFVLKMTLVDFPPGKSHLGEPSVPRRAGAALLCPQTVQKFIEGFLGGSMVKNVPANEGDMGSIPGLGRPHMPQSN